MKDIRSQNLKGKCNKKLIVWGPDGQPRCQMSCPYHVKSRYSNLQRVLCLGWGWSEMEGRKELSKISDKKQILGGQARLSSLFFGSCYGKEPITLSSLKPTAKRP